MPFSTEQKELLKIGYRHSGVPSDERAPFEDWLDEDPGDKELFGDAIRGLYNLLIVGDVLNIIDVSPEGVRTIHLPKARRGKSIDLGLNDFIRKLWEIGVETCDIDKNPFQYAEEGRAIYPDKDYLAKKQIFDLFESMRYKPYRRH